MSAFLLYLEWPSIFMLIFLTSSYSFPEPLYLCQQFSKIGTVRPFTDMPDFAGPGILLIISIVPSVVGVNSYVWDESGPNLEQLTDP